MRKNSISPLKLKLEWQRWFERWEQMQNGYIPERRQRFNLMLEFPGFPKNAKIKILDLGCGPGSLSFCALEHFPAARVTAIDADPVLLAMGQKVSESFSRKMLFIHYDLCRPDWWESHVGKFDLVLSATALHWLNAQHLGRTYQRIFRVLKPGGCFLNSDHVADDDPKIQARFRRILQSRQKQSFAKNAADDWDSFWNGLESAIGKTIFKKVRARRAIWEGTDDGQPRHFHFSTLKRCGFSEVFQVWQDLGEAIIAARK